MLAGTMLAGTMLAGTMLAGTMLAGTMLAGTMLAGTVHACMPACLPKRIRTKACSIRSTNYILCTVVETTSIASIRPSVLLLPWANCLRGPAASPLSHGDTHRLLRLPQFVLHSRGRGIPV